MTDPNGLNVKVAAVLADLSDLITDTAGILNQVDGLRGVDNLTLGDLNANLVAMRTDLADLTGFGLQGLNTIISSIGFIDMETSSTVLQLLNDIRDHIGFPTGDATTTLLGLLQSIANTSLCSCGPQPPNTTDPDSCAEPFVSDAAHSLPSYDGRTFAYWSTAPTDLLIGTSLDPTVGNAELVPEATFDGWTAYVLSRASNICSLDPSETLVFPTNTWIDISARDMVAFSVPAGADITVYLCNHASEVWTDCVELTSTPGTYSTDVPFSEDAQFIVFSSIPGITTGNTWFADGAEQQVNAANTIVTSNWHGVTITLLSGSTVTIYTVNESGGVSSLPINSVSDSQTITFDTQVVLIHNLAASSPASSPFQVRICPPS